MGGADMEDIEPPVVPEEKNAIIAVTNTFNSLSTEEGKQLAADISQREPEEVTETPEVKQARITKENIARSRTEKATTKKGQQLEGELKKLLLKNKYERTTINLLLEKRKKDLFDLKFTTQDVHEELRRLIELPVAEAWDSISGANTGTVGTVQTKKRERENVNYTEIGSGAEEEIEDEETTQTPTASPKKKVQDTGQQEGKRRNLFSLTPQIPEPKPQQTSPKKKNTKQNGGSTQPP
jgi:hypothetical protein